MDFKRLEYFCTLVEHGSFSKAARSLHISQPPLSQRMKELEEELGVPLIHRTSRSFQVTPAGEALYRRAQFILSYLHGFEKDFLHNDEAVSSLVRIGVCPPCESFIRSSMNELQQKFPHVTFRLWIMDNQSLERHMQEVHLDLCIAQLPLLNQNYKLVRLRSSGFCAVYGEGMQPPAKKTIGVHDLKGTPLLLSRRRDSGGSFDYIMRSFQMEGVEPNVFMETQDNRLMLELLKGGVRAVALVPESELPSDCPLARRALNIADLKTLPVILVLKQAYLSRAAFSVLRFLYEKFRDPKDDKDYLALLFEED